MLISAVERLPLLPLLLRQAFDEAISDLDSGA
jgi:hypothetical protein